VFTRSLPLPKPWCAEGHGADDIYNPSPPEPDDGGAAGGVAGGEIGGKGRQHVTQVEQRRALSMLLSLTTHYLAATCSDALLSNNRFRREFMGKHMLRNEQGEQLVTMGALLALFDVTLRRVATDDDGRPCPLNLTTLFNGTHHESHSEKFGAPPPAARVRLRKTIR
jgi:hypothetical protein